MKKIFKINYGIYPYDVVVCIGNTGDEIVKYLSKGIKLSQAVVESLDSDDLGRVIILENNVTILILKDLVKTPESLGTLVHEVTHAVHFLFDDVGIPITRANDEACAYTIEYLFTKILMHTLKK